MEFLTNLWLPIVAAAAAVWVASALAWMLVGHHSKDSIALPDEDGTLRKLEGIPAGNYTFPHPVDRKQCRDPEFIKKWERGPAGLLTIYPKVSMGKNMVLTLLTYVVVSTLIGYVAWQVQGSLGGDKVKIFQVVGTMGVLSYAFAFIPNQIWFGAYPRAIAMCVIDGVVYGLVTGGVFALLWPKVGVTVPGL